MKKYFVWAHISKHVLNISQISENKYFFLSCNNLLHTICSTHEQQMLMPYLKKKWSDILNALVICLLIVIVIFSISDQVSGDNESLSCHFVTGILPAWRNTPINLSINNKSLPVSLMLYILGLDAMMGALGGLGGMGGMSK